MDKYRKHNYNSLPGDNSRDHNPSFSSTLLDQIYRSIDENNDHYVADDDELVLYRETATMRKKKQNIHANVEAKEEANFQRIEKWMDEKKARENIINTREISAASDHIYQKKNGAFMTLNSSWSSSGSSSGGLFSSEADSYHGVSSHRPKPIRTSIEKISYHDKRNHTSDSVVKRSKLKALKIYGDFKNARQPISPGAKLASFLNSLFSVRENAKKGKISGANFTDASPACSTSRSCLSKTPSTRGKFLDNGTKKSVRFYPESQPHGHDKSLQRENGRNNLDIPDQRNRVNEEVMHHMKRKNQSIEERTRELLKDYARKTEAESEDEDEDEDDDASYASSDLFELDSLDKSGINVRGNYMEELPVYETTYLHANLLAIAD